MTLGMLIQFLEMRNIKMSELQASSIERNLVKRYIRKGDMVFDVGAFQGKWTDLVLPINPKEMHLFEPAEESYKYLLNKFSEKRDVVIRNLAAFSISSRRNFYYYTGYPSLSTIYRRVRAESKNIIPAPNKPIPVLTTTIDIYCKQYGIEHINYLKIDTEGSEWDVITGAEELLDRGRIDFVEFEYGGTYLDANITLEQVYRYLRGKGYKVYKAFSTECIEIPEFLPEYENYEFSIFIALPKIVRV
jgi:FkbM family methyltransferase